MKRVAIALGVLGLIGGITFFGMKPGEVSVTNQVHEVIKEITVNPLDEQIKQREAELSAKYEKIKSLEARVDVLKAERERLDTEITSLNTELASFMIATTSKR